MNLIAAQDKESQHSDSRSMSAAAGIGASIGTNGTSIGITASASVGKGKEDGQGTTQLNTHVTAGNQLTIESGNDTSIKGAVASGKQVIAQVGGDLNIASLQDTATFASKNQSVSVSGTVGAGVSVSGSFTNSKLSSDYASVQEQSGIRAGDGGFQLVVNGNTDLKGGVISSAQGAIDAGKNSLSTGTLTVSDIANHADYKGHSIGLSGGVGGGGDSRDKAPDTAGVAGDSWKLMQTGGSGVNAPIALAASDSESSTTKSGISGGAVTIRNGEQQLDLSGNSVEQALAGLNRDVSNEKDTSGNLDNNFDKAAIQAGFEIVGALGGQVSTFLADKAAEIDKAKKDASKNDLQADELQAVAATLPDGERKQLLLAEAETYRGEAVAARVAADALEDKWGPGGAYRQVVRAVTAAASGDVTGAGSELLQRSVINWAQSVAAREIKQVAEDYGIEEGSPAHAAMHAVSACLGASAAGSSCGAAAIGAATSTIVSSLLAEHDTEGLTNEQKEARQALVQTLIVGATAAAGGEVDAANTAALIEMENNASVKKIFQEGIDKAKTQLSKLGKDGLESAADLLSKLEIKPLVQQSEAIKKYLELAAQKGTLSPGEVQILAILYAANEALFPRNVLDIMPGVGKAIAKAGTLVKNGHRVEDALRMANSSAGIKAADATASKVEIKANAGEKGELTAESSKPASNPAYNADGKPCMAGKCDVVGDVGANAAEIGVRAPGTAIQTYWPPNGGFGKPPIPETLEQGYQFSRYGGFFDESGTFKDFGSFVAPTDVPYGMRALPPGTNLKPLSNYEVVKPIPDVPSGPSAPYFGELGLGKQHQLPLTIQDYLDQGIIRVINRQVPKKP